MKCRRRRTTHISRLELTPRIPALVHLYVFQENPRTTETTRIRASPSPISSFFSNLQLILCIRVDLGAAWVMPHVAYMRARIAVSPSISAFLLVSRLFLCVGDASFVPSVAQVRRQDGSVRAPPPQHHHHPNAAPPQPSHQTLISLGLLRCVAGGRQRERERSERS